MNSRSERHTRSTGAIVAMLSFALLIGYPVSIGPVGMIYRLSGEPEILGSAIDVVYGPLALLLPERLSNAIMEWGNFCMDLVS